MTKCYECNKEIEKNPEFSDTFHIHYWCNEKCVLSTVDKVMSGIEPMNSKILPRFGMKE